MFTILPRPYPDQTVASIAAWVWLQNGLPSWQITLKTLLARRGRTPKLNTVVPFGMVRAYEMLSGAGYPTLDQWLAGHTYLPLLGPFVTPKLRTVLQSRFIRSVESGSRWVDLFNGERFFRTKPVYCPRCVAQELETLGFAYAHRTHQVIGADVCPIHEIALAQPMEGRGGPAAAYGLLVAATDDEHPLLDERPSENYSPIRAGVYRFARWVAAILRGDVPYVPWECRATTMLDRIDLLCTKEVRLCAEEICGTPAIRLAHLMIEAHCPRHLLKFHIQRRSSTYCSYAQEALAEVRKGVRPFPIVRALSTLFSTPEEYVEAVGEPPNNLGVLRQEVCFRKGKQHP